MVATLRLQNCSGVSREIILAQPHMQSLAARCRAACISAADHKPIKIDAPTGLQGPEIGALYLHAPGRSVTYHRGWRPWKAYLLLEHWDPHAHPHWYDFDPVPLHNGLHDDTVEMDATEEMPFLRALACIEHILIALMFVACLSLCCKSLPLAVGYFIPLSSQTQFHLSFGASLCCTAFALFSGLYQFSIGTNRRTWEGILALAVGLLVPPATYWMDSWFWVFDLSF
ncbi:MAG: hypothetical protein K2W82_16055 [Candidatus Obscuribacterales bacterium]|nr:hypothetical protein [Candidatus Obscuribacterales bacterium]